MRVDLRSNARAVISGVDRLNSQMPFAVASALTAQVKSIQATMPSALEQDLDRPTDFTKRSVYIVPARKDKLEASVGIKDKQAEYLLFQVRGGERFPRRRALKLPSEALVDGASGAPIKLDAHGNIRRADLRRMVNAAKQANPTQRKGKAKPGSVFYGVPKNRPGASAGLFQRTDKGLLPLVLFPQRSAKYSPRFRFYERAREITNQQFEQLLAKSWARALATAR